MANEVEAAASRARRRDIERRKNGGNKTSGRPMNFDELPLPDISDPPEYLESKRLVLLQALLVDAAETDDRELRARIIVNLLKFSSMGRSSVDLVHSLKRDELPDLSKLFSEADLERLVSASPEALEGFASRLAIAEQARTSDTLDVVKDGSEP